MSYSIKATKMEENYIWPMDHLNKKENPKLEEIPTGKMGRKRVSILPALLMPIRTNNLKNFSKDFFLPTFVNHALKVNNTALKIIASSAAILADLATLPIRVLTVIPRCIHNHIQAKETHPRKEGKTKVSKILENNTQPKVDPNKKLLEAKLNKILDIYLEEYTIAHTGKSEKENPNHIDDAWEPRLHIVGVNLDSTVKFLLEVHETFVSKLNKSDVSYPAYDALKEDHDNPTGKVLPELKSDGYLEGFSELYGSDGSGFKPTLTKLNEAFAEISSLQEEYVQKFQPGTYEKLATGLKEDYEDLDKEVKVFEKMLENIDEILELKQKLEKLKEPRKPLEPFDLTKFL